MVLGWEALAQQAEAERLRSTGLAYGAVDTSSVKVDGAIQVYALDADIGFAPLRASRSGGRAYTVSAPSGSGIRLVPSAAGLGAVRRTLALQAGDTLSNIVITDYSRGARQDASAAEAISFTLLDTTAIPVIFDGQHLRFAQ
jgi:hypothetical protein